MEPRIETISVVYQPLRWAVTNGRYVILVTYDKGYADLVLNSLKNTTNPQVHWIALKK